MGSPPFGVFSNFCPCGLLTFKKTQAAVGLPWEAAPLLTLLSLDLSLTLWNCWMEGDCWAQKHGVWRVPSVNPGELCPPRAMRPASSSIWIQGPGILLFTTTGRSLKWFPFSPLPLVRSVALEIMCYFSLDRIQLELLGLELIKEGLCPVPLMSLRVWHKTPWQSSLGNRDRDIERSGWGPER